MRKPFISANWKMNKTIEETEEFINSFLPIVKDVTDVDILIAPPFTSLGPSSRLLKTSNVILAAQNIFYEEKGAYTGEISPVMIKSAGCSCVIIGHSERRQFFSETDEIVNKKIKTARKNGLEVILCIGESLQERPIWAIGTGKTATKEQANEAHTYIRDWLKKNREGADELRILYGGSVTPENIESLMSEPEVDGALVGGASLKPDSFAKIVTGAIKK
jgi:triosephosphate isomerase